MVSAELLAEIIANPDDDGPRLVWADAIGGERGELVVLQCELANRTDLSLGDRAVRRSRARELIRLHGREWSGLAGTAKKVEYQRGFVVAAELALSNACADEILATAPLVRGVALVECQADAEAEVELAMAEWFGCPLFARLRECQVDQLALVNRTEDYFDDPIPNDALAERVLAAAIDNNAFAHLRGLAWAGVLASGAHRLVAARALRTIERLRLSGQLSVDAWAAILSTTPNLRALDLSDHALTPELVRVIPSSVVALKLGSISAAQLALLGPQLEELHLYNGKPLIDGLALSRFQRLRTLVLKGTRAVNLARMNVPALRELRVEGLALEQVEKVAYALGHQLDRFDVWHGERDRVLTPELHRMVAGELRYEQGEPGPWRFGMGFDWDPPSLVL